MMKSGVRGASVGTLKSSVTCAFPWCFPGVDFGLVVDTYEFGHAPLDIEPTFIESGAFVNAPS